MNICNRVLIHRQGGKQHLAVRLIRVFPLAWLTKYTVFTISFPWFRFTHMDLALRVLFHRFQKIFDKIRLTFSVATGTIKINKCITAVSTVNIPKPRRSCSWTYKINKFLVSPNERLSNIIPERTIEYNTTQHHVLTCLSQVITCLSYGTSLLAVTIINNYAVTWLKIMLWHALQELEGWPFWCPYRNVGFPEHNLTEGNQLCTVTGQN